MITWQIIHNENHLLSDEVVEIAQSFTGNSLSVTITASEYKGNQQIIGWLHLYSGFTEKRYALFTFDEVIALVLPEADRLEFRPTKFLSDNYGLKIAIATVDNGSNSNNATVSIPAIILGLPDRVASLESVEPPNFTSQFNGIDSRLDILESIPLPNFTNQFDGIDNRLDILESIPVNNFTPEFSGINNRLSALESVSIPSFNTVVLTENGTLQSYKSYFAGVANLAVALPVSPAIGDTIELTTGNYDLRVLHGNANQVILNSNTQTLTGVSSGILLKPFSSIKLLLVSTNLWISTARARNINNFSPLVLESTATFKSYTPSITITPSQGTNINNIKNGVKIPTGVFQTDGFLAEVSTLNLLITFLEPILLSQIRVWGGQGNNGIGDATLYGVSAVAVYRGNNTSQLIGTASLPNQNAVEHIRNFTEPVTASATYLLVFTGNVGRNQVGIIELDMFGRGAGGGETSVI